MVIHPRRPPMISLLVGILLFFGMVSPVLGQDFAHDPFEVDTEVGVVGRKTYDAQLKFHINLYGCVNPFDQFMWDFLVGGGIQFNILDWLGIDFRYYRHFASTTNDFDDAKALASNEDQFFKNLALNEMAGHLVFMPFYGKHHLWNVIFVNYTFYFFGGVSYLQFDEDAQLAEDKDSTIGASFGVGMLFYLSNLLHISLELRDIVFKDESFNKERWTMQFDVQLAVGVTLPTFDEPQRKI